MEQKLLEAVQGAVVEGEIACADAHAIAHQLGVMPLKLGQQVTAETKVRFNRCQLGLFGYGAKAEGKSKIVLKATNIPEDIVAELRAATVAGRIPCATAWAIADQHKYPRLGLANIIETLGMRVSPCQLGCF